MPLAPRVEKKKKNTASIFTIGVFLYNHWRIFVFFWGIEVGGIFIFFKGDFNKIHKIHKSNLKNEIEYDMEYKFRNF